MFDANMRYLPKGRWFFAKVQGASDSMASKGVKANDLILCHMLNSGNEKPCVDMILNGKPFTISDDTDFYDNWFVFEGNFDLTGFIDKESKEIAGQIIKDRM